MSDDDNPTPIFTFEPPAPESAPGSAGARRVRARRRWQTPALLAVAGLLLWLSWSGTRPERGNGDGPCRRAFTTMTTEAAIQLHPAPGMVKSPEQALDDAEAAIRRVEELMNPHRPDSDVHRLNHAPPGEWVAVDPLTWRVVMAALRMHVLTDGAFDPTIGPLKKLYPYPAADNSAAAALAGNAPPSPAADGEKNENDGGDEDGWPMAAEIDAARQNVGAQHLRFDRDGMRLSFARPGMRLDLSALAKGFAVDRAVAALQAAGVVDAMVSIGGELRTIGTLPADEAGWGRQHIGPAPNVDGADDADDGGKSGDYDQSGDDSDGDGAATVTPGRRRWRIGIRHPRRPGRESVVLERSPCAVATSGDYARFILRDGRRQSHIIDPRDGRPIVGGLVSVTVLSPDSCMLADAVATALTVLGPAGGENFLAERADDLFRDGLEVWWTHDDGGDGEVADGGGLTTERLLIPGPGLAATGARPDTPLPARAPTRTSP